MVNAIHALCEELQTKLTGEVVFRGSSKYKDITQTYWSLQESNIRPQCFVQPGCAQDVSLIISEIGQARSAARIPDSIQFAIKAGGHTAWPGSANIENGVTIDLALMNDVQVSVDQTQTQIGSGARWADVYSTLDEMNLAVVGGRASQIGVGGLTTGGGLSFFSPRKGLACDNVIDFEVVLADASIVHANAQTNRNLWIALKGGSNNFGIVTRFTVATFAQGDLWGGIHLSSIDIVESQLAAFQQFTSNPDYDEYAVLIQSITYNSSTGARGIANNIHYTKGQSEPVALQPFWSVTSDYSTLRNASLLSLTAELGAFSPNGRGDLYMTLTLKSDLDTLREAYSLYNATISGLASVQNLFWALILQPLPPVITNKTQLNGPNALGLDSSRPLVLVLVSSAWDLESDTAQVVRTARKLVADIQRAAEARGTYDKYVYLNYAYKDQDPISGYGQENKQFLQSVSHQYDPTGLFQTSCPGGFKVFP